MGIGGDPVSGASLTTYSDITIDETGGTSNSAVLNLKADRASEGQDSGEIRFFNNNSDYYAAIQGERGSADTKGDLVFANRGASLHETMRLDEDGNVLFGVANAKISGSVTSTGSFGTIQTTTGTIPTFLGNTTFKGQIYLGSSNQLRIYSEGAGGSDNQVILGKLNDLRIVNQHHGGNIRFEVENSSGTATQAMTIDGDGNAAFLKNVSGSVTSTGSFGRVEADIFSGSFHGQIGARYVFTQSTPATTWTIPHNLGSQYPNVTVYDESDEMVLPTSVTATNTNEMTLTFNIAVAGVAMVGLGGHSSNQGRAFVFSKDAVLLYTSPSPRDAHESRMPSSA